MGIFRTRPRRATLALAAVMKNEAPYLLEWIAWHQAVGVDRFVIGDNDSDDGTTQILQELQSHDLVRTFHVPTARPRSPQFDAYDTVARDFHDVADWFAFIDADEFLFPMNGDEGVRAFIADIPAGAGAIALNWAVYGSSGRVAPGAGPVTSRFTGRGPQAFGPNRHYKSLIRGDALAPGTTNPHHLPTRPETVWLDGDLRPLENYIEGKRGLTSEVHWSRVRLNHYVVKSKYEYWMRKSARGRATGARERIGDQLGEEFFARHDANQVQDEIPRPMRDEVAARVAQLKTLLTSLPDEARDADLLLESRAVREGIRLRPKGSVARLSRAADGAVIVEGWAIEHDGAPSRDPRVRIDGVEYTPSDVTRVRRADVQRVHSKAHPTSGVRLCLDGVSAVLDGRRVHRVVLCSEGGDRLYGDERELSVQTP